MEQAFKDLAFPSDEVDGLFALVAGVLSLGNIKFRETKPDESEVDPATKKWLDAAAKNFGVEASVLQTALCSRELKLRGAQTEKTFAVQDVKQAGDARNAMSKFTYTRMFEWLVTRINKSVSGGGSGGQM